MMFSIAVMSTVPFPPNYGVTLKKPLTFFLFVDKNWEDEGTDPTNVVQPGYRLEKFMASIQVIHNIEGCQPNNIGNILHGTIKTYETDHLGYQPPEKLYWYRKDGENKKFNMEGEENHLEYISDKKYWFPETGVRYNLMIFTVRLDEDITYLYNQT